MCAKEYVPKTWSNASATPPHTRSMKEPESGALNETELSQRTREAQLQHFEAMGDAINYVQTCSCKERRANLRCPIHDAGVERLLNHIEADMPLQRELSVHVSIVDAILDNAEIDYNDAWPCDKCDGAESGRWRQELRKRLGNVINKTIAQYVADNQA